MSDYCGIYYGSCTPGANGEEDKINVQLKFLRTELLYDIKNYAYIEGDVMGEEKQHAQHMLVDIGEEGNVDRVTRILGLVHAAAVEMLYPLTKIEPITETLDDKLTEPEEYVIDMNVPVTMSRTTMQLLSKLIHEFLVYSVLADWLAITNPQAAANWAAKVAAVKDEINSAKSARRKAFTRKTHPW